MMDVRLYDFYYTSSTASGPPSPQVEGLRRANSKRIFEIVKDKQ